MKRHKDRALVLNGERPSRFGCRVRVLKEDRLERVFLEVDRPAVDGHHLEVKHRAVALELVELGGEVVAGEDEVLLGSALLLGVEGDEDVDRVARVQVELRGKERERADLQRVRLLLLLVVLVLLAEELEAAVAAGVHTAERHVDAVAEPARAAVERVHQVDDRRVASRADRDREVHSLRHDRELVVEVAEARCAERDKDKHAHARSDKPLDVARHLHLLDREVVAAKVRCAYLRTF